MKRIYYFKSREFGNYKTYNEALFKRLVKRAAELRATFVCWSDLEKVINDHKYTNRAKCNGKEVA